MDWFISITDLNDLLLHMLTMWGLGYIHGLMFLTVKKVFENLVP